MGRFFCELLRVRVSVQRLLASYLRGRRSLHAARLRDWLPGGVACIRARVLSLLIGACFLAWSVVDHGRAWTIDDVVYARPHLPLAIATWLRRGRSCRVARAARACVPALCGICTRVDVWSLGRLLGHQGTQKHNKPASHYPGTAPRIAKAPWAGFQLRFKNRF